MQPDGPAFWEVFRRFLARLHQTSLALRLPSARLCAGGSACAFTESRGHSIAKNQRWEHGTWTRPIGNCEKPAGVHLPCQAIRADHSTGLIPVGRSPVKCLCQVWLVSNLLAGAHMLRRPLLGSTPSLNAGEILCASPAMIEAVR